MTSVVHIQIINELKSILPITVDGSDFLLSSFFFIEPVHNAENNILYHLVYVYSAYFCNTFLK